MGTRCQASWACAAVLIALALGQTSCSPAVERAAERPSLTPNGVPATVLLVDVDGASMRVRPVDPVTLLDAPGVQPLSLENNYTGALSPDGRTLAAITWPKGRTANRGGALHVMDLVGWTDRKTTVTFDDHVRQLLFGPDGRELYWVRPGPMTGEPALNPDPGVYRYDLAADKLTLVVALPALFLPEFAGVGIAGDRMAIVGSTVGAPGPSRVAEVYVVDLAKATIVAKFDLVGIRAGQVRDPGSSANEVRDVRPGLGWDLPRGRVYVIDADDDRVAVIDLASAAMRGPVVVRPRASLIDHLLGLVSSPADAKDQSNSERRAIVSSDGRRLYVSGFRSDVVAGAVPQVTPLPLQMIDTADMTQLGRIDLASTDIAVSPDGRRLLAVTHRFEPSGWTGYELRLVDTERSTQIASIALEDRGHLIGFASGGDAAYVAAHVGWETTLLRRVALADLRVEQIRKIDHSVGELLFPTAR